MAKKKQPKVFVRNGEYANAYTAADEVRLVYNGWSEYKAPEPAPAADATADADTTESGSEPAKATKATAKKAS